MDWLVTGGAGFIGANLVASLLADPAGHRVTVLDSFATTGLGPALALPAFAGAELLGPAERPGRRRGRLRLQAGDIRDPEALLQAAEGADVVAHLAANTGVAPSVADPRRDCEANVMGTLNALEAARRRGVARFVFASSGAPAGLVTPPITEDVVPRPISPYGASKLAGEAYCSAYAGAYGMRTVALRFSNVYGPGSRHKGSVVATFIRAALEGRPIRVNGDGTQTRDFVHVDDLVRAVRLAAQAPGEGAGLYQIATRRETSINELLALLGPLLRAAGVPEPAVERAERSPADVLRNFADPARAAAELGWRPRIGLEEGLEGTLAWFLGRPPA